MTLDSPISVFDYADLLNRKPDHDDQRVQNHPLGAEVAAPSIKTISESFIKPKHLVEEAKNPVYLAPWDLYMLSFNYIQKGLLFHNPIAPSKSNSIIMEQLKNSLSLALVHFYPLAGRLETQVDETNHSSLIYINPNNGPGARFIHASINLTVSDILSPTYVPQSVIHSFFDHHKAVNHDGHTLPLLTVKATELIDGGVFLGVSINHVCADGTSFWHFLNIWSEIHMNMLSASSNYNDNHVITLSSISRPPIHRRWFVDGTGPIINLPYTHLDEFIARCEHHPRLTERIFHFTPESIAKLKSKANSDCETNEISSFQALSALVWRSITRARRCPLHTPTRCMLAVNNRARLQPPLSQDYFGNAVQPTKAVCVAGDLLGQTLGWAGKLLNQAVAGHVDGVVRRDLQRWMNGPFVYRLGETFDPYSVMMGSSPRFDMYGNEFGMGKPVAVRSGYANKFDGKTTSYPGREAGGSVDLEICLLPDHMSALESDQEFMDAVV